MNGAIAPLPHYASWRGGHLKRKGNITLVYFTLLCPFEWRDVDP
jgi:hypothetical protein